MNDRSGERLIGDIARLVLSIRAVPRFTVDVDERVEERPEVEETGDGRYRTVARRSRVTVITIREALD